ncbi:aldehyde dehydrogenase family protein [Mesorhizobium sp. IMUNJ 23033]|uniref:aldehyde dehydrogenase family protein n=1 Tax=Mesorhizobium sp. IMUNJ 23033 TaxID=3378039 RepID=UPI00384ACACB
MTINGQAATSLASFQAFNPATEQVLATVPEATREQLDEAVDAAAAAFPEWSARPVEDRQALVARVGGQPPPGRLRPLRARHPRHSRDRRLLVGGRRRRLCAGARH